MQWGGSGERPFCRVQEIVVCAKTLSPSPRKQVFGRRHGDDASTEIRARVISESPRHVKQERGHLNQRSRPLG